MKGIKGHVEGCPFFPYMLSSPLGIWCLVIDVQAALMIRFFCASGM